MFLEYMLMFKYFFVCMMLASMLFLFSFVFMFQTPDSEKMSIYECGFSPFGDSSNSFEVKFYMVAMLFMMFDLEMIFLFPWMMVLNDSLPFFSFISMMIFLVMLTVGFVYEWTKGALNWH